MLHLTGIKNSLYDFQNISSLYWKRLTLPNQLTLGETDATVVNVILRQDRVTQCCILIQHIFNIYTESYIEELGIRTGGKLVYNLRNDDIANYRAYSHKIVLND